MDEPKDELEFLEKMSDEELLAWMKNFTKNLPGVLDDLGMPQSVGDEARAAQQRFEEARLEEAIAHPKSPLQVPHIDERKPH